MSEYQFPLERTDYEVAEKNGISKMNVYNRYYKLLWTKERAITEPVKVTKRRKEPEKLKELKAPSFLQLAKENGISPKEYYKAIHEGNSPEWAAVHARKIEKKPRFISKEYERLARYHGIPLGTVRGRLGRGMPVEEAVSKPLHTRN